MIPNDVTWQELNDPHNEWGTLDFDNDRPNDDADWWRHQDEAMQAEELERIEIQAEAEELRHNGYWD